MMGRGDGVGSDDRDDRPKVADTPLATVAAPSKGNLVFTLNEIPYSRWPDRLQEFLAYLTTRALTVESNHDLMSDFVSRFTGTLRNWWTDLGEHEQVQFLIKNPVEAIYIMHVFFVGNPDDLKELKRIEFFERRCCSYKRKHLDLHFKHMARRKRVIDCTVGEIQQEIHVALEDACKKKEVVRQMLKGDKAPDKACKRPKLYTKCSGRYKNCSYSTKKKKHYKKWKFSKAKSRRYSGKKLKYLIKKKRFGKKFKSSRSYICNWLGHFAKNYPKALKLGMKLVQQLETATGISLDKDDVESLFSLDEEAGPSSIATLEVLKDSDSSFSEFKSDTCYRAVEETERINLVNSVPHFQVSLYTSKYMKPIKVIAFLDIGTTQTIMNPKVLPQECWKPYTKHFSNASSEVFFTHLISKPIKIQFFLGCFLITRVLGSALLRNDIVVGWDVITKANKFRMTPEGVRFKHYFQPNVQIPRLFMAKEDEVKQILNDLVQDLKQQSCANSYQSSSISVLTFCGKMSSSLLDCHLRKMRTSILPKLVTSDSP
ncbi:hypothetical protein CRG98_018778 [Punica granatum]|uniref:Uncharacterized protein n=1 Tax=Punica granatum TaxID=22663 RepID=A0A2I0JWU5_PUNGR|nr:hypothetical protein CRG98_018778 [Punica granatum]